MLALALAISLAAAAPAKTKKPEKKPTTSQPAAPAPEPATPEVSSTPAPAPEPAPAPARAPEPAATAAAVTPPSATSGGTQPRVGVVDFSSTPELQPLAGALAGFVANELQRLGAFQVTTTDQIRQMLSLERQAQLLGCPDDSCRGELVVSLGFDFVVTGKVTKLPAAKGNTFTLELVLIDQKKGQRIASDVAQGTSESELMGRVSPSAVKLVNAPLKARSGGLVLASSEAGATVKIDDVVVGTTPVGQASVAGGPHYVSVEKDGFVSWQKEVRVKPDETTEENVRLVPSPDFIAAYKSKQGALRIGMYGAAALAVAGVVTGVICGLRAQSLYGSESQQGTFLYERKYILMGVEEDSSGNHRELAASYKAQVETMRAVSYVGVGLGAAFGLTAAVLRLISDDPGKYDMYKATDVKVKVGATFGPGSAGAVLAGSF